MMPQSEDAKVSAGACQVRMERLETFKTKFLSGLIQITCKNCHLKPDFFKGSKRGKGGGVSVEVQGVGSAVQKTKASKKTLKL